jgi:predicted MFS family arabinose efflux permease
MNAHQMRYRPLVVLAVGTFAVGTDGFVVAGLLPQMAASLRVSVAAAAQCVTVYALAYAALAPLLAATTARWPRRRVLLTGLAVFVAGNAATALLSEFGLVLIGRAIAGAGGAMYTPTALATAATIAPERWRGRALSVVMAGLTVATALGAPIGTGIGAVVGWRATMGFVTLLGLLAGVGVLVLLPAVPASAPIGLRERLAPIGDRRVALTLTTAWLVFGGLYTVYTYVGPSFDRATGGAGTTLAVLLVVWGAAATVGNLVAGSLTDRIGPRSVLNGGALIAAANFALLPWTSGHLVPAALAMAVWGICGWGMVIPNMQRLIGIAPTQASLVNALHSTVLYLGAAASGPIGAAGIAVAGRHALGPLGAVLIVLGLVTAERAHRAVSAGRAQARTTV